MIVTDVDNVTYVQGALQLMRKEFGPRRYHGLVCQLDGRTRYLVGEQAAIQTERGRILYLPEGIPYRVIRVEPGDCIAINFHLREDPGLPAFLAAPRSFSQWRDLFFEAHSSWSGGRPGYLARCRAMIYQALAMLEEQQLEQTLPAAQRERIEAVCAYLAGHLEDPRLSVDACLKRSGMSATRFRSLFRQVYGTSPRQYLIGLRISRAKGLLTATGLSVTQVAESCGFESIYHFSKAFKQATGCSPSAYREDGSGRKEEE